MNDINITLISYTVQFKYCTILGDNDLLKLHLLLSCIVQVSPLEAREGGEAWRSP